MNIGRPYYDILTVAMKRVFAAQGRPWRTPRVHMVAVLLGLFGGFVGLHHFYLGDRRRGWRDVRFFWSGVPIVLRLDRRRAPGDDGKRGVCPAVRR